jgi:hypothetical protein
MERQLTNVGLGMASCWSILSFRATPRGLERKNNKWCWYSIIRDWEVLQSMLSRPGFQVKAEQGHKNRYGIAPALPKKELFERTLARKEFKRP